MFKFFFSKTVPFMGRCVKLWKNRTEHRWQYNTAHALWMLDTQGYKHNLRMCNTYCFFLLRQWLQERASILRWRLYYLYCYLLKVMVYLMTSVSVSLEGRITDKWLIIKNGLIWGIISEFSRRLSGKPQETPVTIFVVTVSQRCNA